MFPPPRKNRVSTAALFDTSKYLLLMLALLWLVISGSEKLGYNWQWYRIPQYFGQITETGISWGPLMKGLAVTMEITAISMLFMLVIGLTTALLRMTGSRIGCGLARIYMELIRNSPLLIQIFFIYFVIAPILNMSGFWAAVIALSLFEGAYASEIFRAGITSINQGQWEAAKSLGMNVYPMYRYIILPQAIRRIIPPLTSQAVSLVKDSALVSTVAILDLTQQGRIIDAETFLTFEIWFTVAAIYLCITLTLSTLVRILEQRTHNMDSTI